MTRHWIMHPATSRRLFSSSVEGPRNQLFILHGLFGNKNNWNTIKKGIESGSNWQVHSLDLLNHGSNCKVPKDVSVLDLKVLAKDVVKQMENASFKDSKVALMGHSLGGKVALTIALESLFPLERLIAVDISPRSYAQKIKESDFCKYIKQMQMIESLGLMSRDQVDELLKQVEPRLAIRQFLMTNLISDHQEGKEGGNYYKFRNNLNLMERSLEIFMDFPIKTDSECSIPSLFIRGSKSNYVTDEDVGIIKKLFPLSQVKTIEGGHWIHSENPTCFLKALLNFFLTKDL